MFISGPRLDYSPAYGDEWQVRFSNDMMLNVGLVICDLIIKNKFNVIQPDFWSRALLFCILEYLPCSVSFRCMNGVGVEVWTITILCQFIEAQTHFKLGSVSQVEANLTLLTTFWACVQCTYPKNKFFSWNVASIKLKITERKFQHIWDTSSHKPLWRPGSATSNSLTPRQRNILL